MVIIYEDGAAVVRLLEEGATIGHLVVEPRTDVKYLDGLSSDVAAHLFTVASYAATAVFEGLGAQGTNILVVEGADRLQLQVLPRQADDGIDLFWDPKRAEPAALEEVASKLKDELWYVGKEQEKEPDKAAIAERLMTDHAPDVKGEKADPDKNYKLRQLRRRL